MPAVVSEGIMHRPSSFGLALTGSAGTDGARRQKVVAVPVCSAKHDKSELHTHETASCY
jgi:nicotinamide mononucleotide (NMN) deamidase PncC